MSNPWHLALLFGAEPVFYCKAGIGTIIGRIQLGAGVAGGEFPVGNEIVRPGEVDRERQKQIP